MFLSALEPSCFKMMSEANTFAQRVYFDLLYLSTMQYWMKRHTYLVMVLLLIIFETIHIVIGYWSGDFWQHAAVVNELSKIPARQLF